MYISQQTIRNLENNNLISNSEFLMNSISNLNTFDSNRIFLLFILLLRNKTIGLMSNEVPVNLNVFVQLIKVQPNIFV